MTRRLWMFQPRWVSSRSTLHFTSRARSAAGFFLLGKEFNCPQPRSDQDKISVEMKTGGNSQIDNSSSAGFWKKRDEGTLIIGYQNLPHLYKHAASVAADHNLSPCDILYFVKTPLETSPYSRIRPSGRINWNTWMSRHQFSFPGHHFKWKGKVPRWCLSEIRKT